MAESFTFNQDRAIDECMRTKARSELKIPSNATPCFWSNKVSSIRFNAQDHVASIKANKDILVGGAEVQ